MPYTIHPVSAPAATGIMWRSSAFIMRCGNGKILFLAPLQLRSFDFFYLHPHKLTSRAASPANKSSGPA